MTSSRFLVGMLAMLAMLALAAGQVEPESELDCYDGPFENVLLDGCVDDCQSFESLADAEAHCNSIVECGYHQNCLW